MIPDHYQALGVQPYASAQEVRAAYRRVMRENHPDVRPGDETAAGRARAANAAWQVLRDAAQRASYDRLREHGPDGRLRPTVRRAEASVVIHPSYSAEKQRLARDMHFATVRLGIAVFVLGCLLLLLTR